MAVPSKITLYQLNDQYLEIDGLADGLTTTVINTAVVTATLKDSTGASVSGLTNLSLTYVASSSGVYRGLIEDTFNPAIGGGYTLYIDAVDGGVNKGHWEIPVVIKVRKS
jgi:hypothetical protein